MDQTEFYKLLIKRYVNNEASAEEIEALFHLIKIGEIDDLVQSFLESDAGSFAEDEAVKVPVVETAIPLRSGDSKQKLYTFIKIAASLLVILGLTMLIYTKKPAIGNYFNPVKYVTVEAAHGKVKKLILSDGSEVWLNAGSTLRYPEIFTSDKRELVLEGEAFFNVHHDPEKAFIIHSSQLNTVVMGTSFNVKSYRNEPSQITVRTGKVAVAEKKSPSLTDKSKTVFLSPAQQTTYIAGTGFTLRDHVDPQEYMGWQKGNLVFTGKTLLQMKSIIERWYDVKIVLENKKLESCSMVGSYHQETLRNILEAMRFSLNITYKISGKVVTIKGGKCN